MDILESIFCYLHAENEKEGKPISYDATSGNMIISLCLVMLPIGLFFWILLLSPNTTESLEGFLDILFGPKNGKFIGQFLILTLLILIFPTIKKTIGTQENYERILELYLNMSEIEQEKAVKKGRNLFGFSLLFFGLPVFTLAIRAAF